MAAAPVHTSLLPDVSAGTPRAAQLLPLLLNVPAAEQESVQQPEGGGMPPNAHKTFLEEPKLPLYPVQQLQKQCGALACGQSRGCTLQLKVSLKKTEGDHHSFPQSLCALLMATGGFGVKDGVTWYMLGNTLLAEGEGYSLGKKIMEENSNYENRKYTHKRKHYCTVR